MKLLLKRIAFISVAWVLAVSCFAATKVVRPTLYGFALAFPLHIPVFNDQGILPFIVHETNVTVEVTIDTKGNVQSVKPSSPADSSFVKAFSTYFSALLFEPARAEGKPVTSTLLATIRLVPNYPLPYITFPIDTVQTVVDRSLYLQSMEHNEIVLPQLTYFPSYWCNLQVSDTGTIARFILLQVFLDKEGKILDVRSLRSTYPAFVTQLIAATTRATITPASVNGKPVASSVYLCLTFFPGNNYPTIPYAPKTVQSLPLRERLQLVLLPDTVGLLLKPIPKFNPAETIEAGAALNDKPDTVAVFLAIDSMGGAGSLSHDHVSPEASQWIGNKAAWMKFYPAIDFQGRPSTFTGTAYFIFSDSTSVRILYPWLK